LNGGNRAQRRRQNAPASEIFAAAEHHKAGRLDKAEALCRKILQRAPDDINALHLLGIVSLERGHADRAIELIGRALARFPEAAQAHGNLGNAYRAARRFAEACASYRRAIALQPDFAPAHTNLGSLLYEQGDFAGALASCRRAVELDPRNPEALTNLGNVHRALGELEPAETALRRAVLLRPENADFHVNLGNVLIDRRRPEDAAACYRRAIDIRPGLARAHYGLGVSRTLAGDAEGAVDSYRAAIALAPGQAALWNDLGRALRALGQFDDAAEAFRQALAIDPNFADAYRNLASCRELAADDAEITRVAALADQPDLPAEERVIAGFALGKLLDDSDRFDAAFAAYARANAAYREMRAATGERFDADALRRVVDETIANYTPAFFASIAEWGNPSELPVFIVGMPRSSTSLVEQIAASHSRVFGAGELKDIGELAGALGGVNVNWRRSEVRRLADIHLERLRALGRGTDRVIDKLPDNVFQLGVIAALFPSARIIFCDRDPRDIALSCFFQKFAAGQLTFSYDLADCGKRCRETARLIAHWRRVLPLRMLDVGYEALVADPEAESRRLVAFLGLDWEPACLDFHRTQRTVMTASAWQVRQPLFTRSVGRWRHYQPHLGPLLAALDTAEAEESGSVT
jgi:Flp pilus assembly protein TadD